LAEVLLIKAVLNYSQNVFLLTMLYNQKKTYCQIGNNSAA
jgi:hypothetical protein